MSTVPQKRFANQVVIITGASSGFGLAAAEAFYRQGARVVMAARDPKRLAQAAAGLQPQGGSEPLCLPCDVSKRDDVDKLVAEAIAHFDRIDILINNAGSGLIAPIETIRVEDAKTLFNTN